ncbi:germ cell-specific gene 1-like protein isoform X1 [Cyprinodon tularosa]|uniref:germ cell-specific gene 1-like protein isoform X1 n=1 Tax=Cyprinodon tularosa TaxID=77115 RepID=UPI0018E1EC30|nr:germ cell-specific gene 1-like protein isoform X1 [Cyprinodon tularosa]XP_038158716.1 germ cell-specific gene 1-like protein isoform X1 [Cyprinodon tularosa]XP_038158717.1 germ cell-specific gene 1-like protein isoform X1 [Cyprinodon tularosa]
MLEKMSRRNRTLLSLGLTSLALTMSVSAFCTSYWCEGTHKVVKPICLSPVKLKNCGKNNSQPYTTEAPTVDPSSPVSNVTLSPKQKEELALLRKKQLANAVQYLWETGEDKYMLRYFHTGFWLSCEKHNEGDDQEEKCRSFIELTPGETQGVLWLAVISEFMYIGLLAMGFLLMCVEALCLCAKKEMSSLKVNAYAAMCTVLSGLMGMVAHMMYTTVFQMTVSIGPKDWRPQSWDYGWSFALAWLSFSCCMAAAVATLNSYTKTIIEMKHRARLRLEEARAATIAPPYEEVVRAGGGSLYSISQLVQLGQQGALMDPLWPRGVGPAVGPLACSAGGALLVGAGVGGIGMGMGGAGPGGIPAMGGVVGVGVEGGVGMGRGSSGGTMGTMAGAKMGTGRMMNTHRVVVVGGCTTEGCTECEREMDEIDYTLREGREDSLC